MMTYPRPKPLTTEQAAYRLWEIRRLLRERALDPLAADVALRPMRESRNPRLAALAHCTTNELVSAFAR